MFTEILSGFKRFFTTQRLIVLLVFIILGYFLMNYAGAKDFISLDGMEDGSRLSAVPQTSDVASSAAGAVGGGSSTMATSAGMSPSLYRPSTISDPSDLLPKDVNSQWATLNPALSSSGVLIPDMLDATSRIGVQVGNVLHNANRQLRSDPPITKSVVSPWNNSTIEPDLMRVPLEIGQGCQ